MASVRKLLVWCALISLPWHCNCTAVGEFNKELEVVRLIEALVPRAVLDHLNWRDRSSILIALRQPRHLQWVELFCGTGTLSLHLSRRLPRGRSIDTVLGSESHNILTVEGFAYCLRSILSICPFGLCWRARPCALWVFLSAGYSAGTCSSPLAIPRGWMFAKVMRL